MRGGAHLRNPNVVKPVNIKMSVSKEVLPDTPHPLCPETIELTSIEN
jgi:hypothetical protein